MALVRPLHIWKVDHGDGQPRSVTVPHAWRQDRDVSDEGPVVYSLRLDKLGDDPYLLFWAVSYQAEVFVDGLLVHTHRGIWDAFSVSLRKFARKEVIVEVRVIKNGGRSFPVREVASGFLPYVFNTFGGMHGGVELHEGAPVLEHPMRPSRVRIKGTQIFVDDHPLYVRGLLHWGWYPELGHPSPSEASIRQEVREAKRLGFNLVKFCLWVPPHRYLDILNDEGMFAWMELPLWAPATDPNTRIVVGHELEQIVRQYRHHDNIVLWTAACELGPSTSVEERQHLTHMVQNLTGSPLVKDNSGGAEMYGGDHREFGSFYDFHPYGEVPLYPVLLDSLLPGARTKQPTLLGECNDFDVHRDLHRLSEEVPYWGSSLSELNAQGVRWQYDLPAILGDSRFAHEPEASDHEVLLESSRQLGLFVRKSVVEAIRAREAIGGYVITGWRDTPISTSGIFDDWGESRFTVEEMRTWNGPDCLFVLPHRSPPWTHGGNRPGWLDPFTVTAGPNVWRIGMHSQFGCRGGLAWLIRDEEKRVVARGAQPLGRVEPLQSTEVGLIFWAASDPGTFTLEVRYGDSMNEWTFEVVAPAPSRWAGRPVGRSTAWDQAEWTHQGPLVSVEPSLNDLEDEQGLHFLLHDGTLPMPFWREAAYEFDHSCASLRLRNQWHRWLSVSPDRALDPSWLDRHFRGWKSVITRISTRTYAEHPLMAQVGNRIVTTLRPFGGIGVQPAFSHNASGQALLAGLLQRIDGSQHG